jgi:HEAT repeat protein
MPTRLAVSIAIAIAAAAQISFEQTIADFSSNDPRVRLNAVRLVKDTAYLEAAIPLANLITDPDDGVQFEAIAAELNIFLAEPVVTRKRVAGIVEKRSAITAEATFSAGPLAIGGRRVPAQVLVALQSAIHDNNGRVGIEALYAFGALAGNVDAAARSELLQSAGPHLAATLGVADPSVRFAAARVIGRVFARLPADSPVDQSVGDSVITALNDNDRAVTIAAMEALGAMRYDRAAAALGELFTYHEKGEPAEAALAALAHIGGPALSLLTAQLSSRIPAFRGIAVEGLARSADSVRLGDLQSTLKTERDEGVLLALAFARTMLANATIDPISDAVTRSRTRAQAQQYLIEIARGRIGMFNRQLQDPDSRIRLAAVEALGLSHDAAAAALVQPLTADGDPLVARAATIAVERLTLSK